MASKWNPTQLWRGKDPKSIVERSWISLKGRFLKHTLANLKENEKEKLVAADKRAKEKRLATGRTWADLYYTTEEDEEILEYIVEKQQYSRGGGEALFKEMAAASSFFLSLSGLPRCASKTCL